MPDLTNPRRREAALADGETSLRDQAPALQVNVRRTREFVAIISHELRNPLVALRSAVASMARKKLDPELARLRETIDRQTGQLIRLVDDLVDLNRLERGEFSVNPQSVLLADVLSHVIETSRPFIEARGHVLTTRWPSEPIELMADPGRLIQVFVNLLQNAARYTDMGGRIALIAEVRRADVTVRVTDTGNGIAPEEIEWIFEPFRQLASCNGSVKAGLGVGLALVRLIVDRHSGTVEARSAGLGHGSEFLVTLPRAGFCGVCTDAD
jgi:signal transduction histidine kinase